jgi:Domain of unknown function (DUF4249)
MKIKHLILIIIPLIIISCVNPFNDFQQISYKNFIVIECHLNDQSFPFQQIVKLNLSSKDITDASPNFIVNAKVYITDNQGNSETFREYPIEQEYRASPTFKGKVGNTYVLHVELPNGTKYESSPETMRQSPDLDKTAQINSEFVALTQYKTGTAERGGFDVKVSFVDSSSLGDYYKLTWLHYERSENCAICDGITWYDYDKNKCLAGLRNPSLIPGPLKFVCEGDCWDRFIPTEINPILTSDQYFNGQRIGDFKVARIPFSDYSPYFFQLIVESITPNTFKYYESLRKQTESNGTQFDIPAETKFSYNLKSLSNPEEKVLGIFDVHSVKIKGIFIDRNRERRNIPIGENPVFNEILYQFALCYTPCPAKCNESNTRTKIKPEGWKD